MPLIALAPKLSSIPTPNSLKSNLVTIIITTFLFLLLSTQLDLSCIWHRGGGCRSVMPPGGRFLRSSTLARRRSGVRAYGMVALRFES